MSPGCSAFSAFRVFSAGNGHFRPVRSSLVVVMRPYMAKGADIVNGHRHDRTRAYPASHRPTAPSLPTRMPTMGPGPILTLSGPSWQDSGWPPPRGSFRIYDGNETAC